MWKKLILGVALLGLAAPATAADFLREGRSFGGGQIAPLTLSEDGASDAEPSALIGRVGTFVGNQLAVEGRFGVGFDDDTVDGVDVEIDRLVGVYGSGHIPMGGTSSLYAVLGYSDVKASFSGPDGSTTDSESGFSYGFGADIGITRAIALNVEFMRYIDRSDVDVEALAVGLHYRF